MGGSVKQIVSRAGIKTCQGCHKWLRNPETGLPETCAPGMEYDYICWDCHDEA